MAWQALLESDVAKAACSELVRSLTDVGGDDGSLARGPAGCALAHAYALEAGIDGASEEIAAGLLDRATESIASATRASLHDGFSGTAWALQHLCPEDGDSLEEIDDVLVDVVPNVLEPNLASGLTGIGVYALERGDQKLLARVVDRLGEVAVPKPVGHTWWSPRSAEWPHGVYEIGMLRGTAGVIALLAAALRAGIGRAEAVLAPGVAWLVEAGREGNMVRFARDTPLERAPITWGTGDLGVAAALLAAADATRDDKLRGTALEHARVAIARPAENIEAGFCDGAAGVAHTLNRLYRATGETWLADAARAWFERVLAMPRGDARGLLDGRAGIALALLGATTAIEPAWDRSMLLSTHAH